MIAPVVSSSSVSFNDEIVEMVTPPVSFKVPDKLQLSPSLIVTYYSYTCDIVLTILEASIETVKTSGDRRSSLEVRLRLRYGHRVKLVTLSYEVQYFLDTTLDT